METFLVTYSGNSRRFKNLQKKIGALTEREAVEKVYQEVLDSNFFPQDDGTIVDTDGEVIARPDDVTIDYDGGCFSAEKMTYDIVFNSDETSNNKGFKLTFEEAKEYIKANEGSNRSFFEFYKGGTVSIVCNQTSDVVFEKEI